MARAIAWWMSAPIEFKHAAAGISAPYILLGLMAWLAH